MSGAYRSNETAGYKSALSPLSEERRLIFSLSLFFACPELVQIRWQDRICSSCTIFMQQLVFWIKGIIEIVNNTIILLVVRNGGNSMVAHR